MTAENASKQISIPCFPGTEESTQVIRREGNGNNSNCHVLISGPKFSISIDETQLCFLLKQIEKLKAK